MSPTLVVGGPLALLGFACGFLDGRSRRAWLIVLLTLAAFYPLIELLYLAQVVPWAPLITRHMAVLSQLDFQLLVPVLLTAYFAGRLLARLSGGRQST